MSSHSERRTEQRLCYHWPVWFGENFNGQLSQGQMADVCSSSAAFTCYSHEWCPYPGQWVTARFSVPRYGPDGSFDMADFIRACHVHRVDSVNAHTRRIAVSFSQPLPFRPGEQQADSALAETQAELEPAMA